MLSAYSTYFDNLFNGPFKERDQEEIPITNVDPTEFMWLLDQLYSLGNNISGNVYFFEFYF